MNCRQTPGDLSLWRAARFLAGLVAACLFVGGGIASAAESAPSLARQGNKLYRQEQYDAAAETYRKALELEPTSRPIQYNLGTALGQNGQLEPSLQALRQATESDDPNLRRDALFNTGVEQVREALGKNKAAGQPPGSQPSNSASPQQPSPDAPPTQLNLLKEASDAFRQAIMIDPTDDEAKSHYEYTSQLLKLLQPPPQQNQQQSDQNKEQSEDQQSQDQQGQSDEQEQKDQQQDQQQDQQNQGEQEQQQQSDQEQSQDQQGEQGQKKQDSGLEGENKEDQEKQDRQENKDQSDKPEQQQKPQPTPGDRQNQGTSGSEGDQNESQPMTPEQMNAMRLLNMLEQERPEQFKRMFHFRGKGQVQRPEKDW